MAPQPHSNNRFGRRPSGNFNGAPRREGGFGRPTGGRFQGARPQGASNFRDSRGGSGRDGGRGRGPEPSGRSKYLNAARRQVQEAYTGKGASLIQAVRAIDDLDNTRSLLFTRLDEWWKIHFPEFRLENEESYCRIVAEFGSRDAFEYEPLEKIVGAEKAAIILSQAQGSFGAEFTSDEKKAVRDMALGILGLIESRKKLEEFAAAQAKVILANVSYLIDPLVAARLLSVAGGLDKLAGMPASTIQVIGAEKALFKHLREGTSPPKHGIIFQSSLIRGAPLWSRGKIARSLAAKLAIAAKGDAYTGHFIADKLKESFDRRLRQINKKGA